MRAFLLALAVGSTRGLATRAAPRMAVGRDAAAFGATSLVPVSGGAITGPAVRASSLWSERGALVFVVRRPG